MDDPGDGASKVGTTQDQPEAALTGDGGSSTDKQPHESPTRSLSSRFVSRRHNAGRIPQETWDRHKRTITELYLDENRSLQDVVEIMRSKHGFAATRRQYVHQFDSWSLRKYNKMDGSRADRIRDQIKPSHPSTFPETAVDFNKGDDSGSPFNTEPPTEPPGAPKISMQSQDSSDAPVYRSALGNSAASRKRLSAEIDSDDSTDQNQELSCPFRKRNPCKFNVRDFQSCALQSFPTIPLLKRHVKTFHKAKSMPFSCPRCNTGFPSYQALNAHLAVDRDRICAVAVESPSTNPEDGITRDVEDMLNERKSELKIDSWTSLYRAIFPEDREVPDSTFVPVVEDVELKATLDKNIPIMLSELGTRLSNVVSDESKDRVMAEVEKSLGQLKISVEEASYRIGRSSEYRNSERARLHSRSLKALGRVEDKISEYTPSGT